MNNTLNSFSNLKTLNLSELDVIKDIESSSELIDILYKIHSIEGISFEDGLSCSDEAFEMIISIVRHYKNFIYLSTKTEQDGYIKRLEPKLQYLFKKSNSIALSKSFSAEFHTLKDNPFFKKTDDLNIIY